MRGYLQLQSSVHLSAVMKCLLRGCYLWLLDWMMLLHCPHLQLYSTHKFPYHLLYCVDCPKKPENNETPSWCTMGPTFSPCSGNVSQESQNKNKIYIYLKKTSASFIVCKFSHNALITVKTNLRSPHVVIVQADN